MVLYVITAKVHEELTKKFEKFMQERHIPDLMKTGHFFDAKFVKQSSGLYRISYHAEDKASLDKYLENDAESLREDFIENFPAGIEISRKIQEQ